MLAADGCVAVRPWINCGAVRTCKLLSINEVRARMKLAALRCPWHATLYSHLEPTDARPEAVRLLL